MVVFKRLPSTSQDVIQDITKRMGQGMASFVGRDLRQGTPTIVEYNLYCHYVAGLVGEGLSRLFSSCGLEGGEVASVATTLANTMGLFLQKTNILRDYLEDYVDGRSFWPKEVWRLYTSSDDLGEFRLPQGRGGGLRCLNHLVTDALQCVPECLGYLDLLHTEEVFRFCAIPQVMAMATLLDLYHNEEVFTGVVKIRKGLAARLILDSNSRGGVHKWFYLLTHELLEKTKVVSSDDPSLKETINACKIILRLTEKKAVQEIWGCYAQLASAVCGVGVAVFVWLLFAPPSLGGRGRGIGLGGGGLGGGGGGLWEALREGGVGVTWGWVGCVLFVIGYCVVAAGRGRGGLVKAEQ